MDLSSENFDKDWIYLNIAEVSLATLTYQLNLCNNSP